MTAILYFDMIYKRQVFQLYRRLPHCLVGCPCPPLAPDVCDQRHLRNHLCRRTSPHGRRILPNQCCWRWEMAHCISISTTITVNIGFRNHPPSEGSRFLNPARPLNQGSWYSNQVVAKGYTAHLFLFPLGLETTTAAILLYKSQILRFLNPRLLFMYWRGSVKGVAVSKPSAAALSKVSKPNVDCISKKCPLNRAFRLL